MLNGKRIGGVVAAVTALALLGACSGGSNGGNEDTTSVDTTKTINGTMPTDGPAEQGGVLKVNTTSDSPTLDPHKTSSVYTHSDVSGIVYSKLLDFKTGPDLPYGSMELKGDLAETWEHSADGLTWTFNLRKGVQFQNIAPVNGREFTSADVVCTIDRIKNLPGAQLNLVGIVAKVETPDAHKVVFTLSTPYAAFDESMASFYLEMLPCEGTRGEFNLAETAIGTGPFILQKWQRGVGKTYVKNPTYYVPGKPHIDQLELIQMGDPAAAVAALRTGELDITGSVNDTLLPSLTSSAPNMVVRNTLTIGPNQIMFNSAKKPFDDYRVRKAVAMAWDREGMAKQFYSGSKISGPIPSVLFGGMAAEDAAKVVSYDPEGAKKLLAEAGFPDGLDVEMLTTDGYGQQFVTQSQWVQEDLKKAGIRVTLKILDYATYFSTFGKKDYSLGWGLSTSFLSADEWLQALYVSNGPRNWFNTNDPTLDAMIKEQQGLVDRDAREKKLLEINQYIMDNILNPFMGTQWSSLLTQQPWVHNLYTHPAYQRSYMADVWLSADAPGRKK